MKSANQLYSDKAVDKISIHTYLAKERIKDFNLVNGCLLYTSDAADE